LGLYDSAESDVGVAGNNHPAPENRWL